MATNKTTSILIGGVLTADKWADQFLFTLYSDSGLTSVIDSKTAPIKQAGSQRIQTDTVSFDSLTLGTRYWVSVVAVVTRTGLASAPAAYTFVAMNSVVPFVSYAHTAVASPSGYAIVVTPVIYPTDIDHYEFIVNYDPSVTPTAATAAGGSRNIDSSGKFSFFAGSGPGQLFIWVRAVNTSGLAQTWVNLTNGTVDNQVKVTAKSVGQYAIGAYGTPSITVNNTPVALPVPVQGFNVVLISPTAPYSVSGIYQFDIASHPEQAATMNTLLRAHTDGTIYVIIAAVETAGHRAENTSLNQAMYSLGASRQIWDGKYLICSAYILVGQWNTGQGNGIELYAGATDLDPNAYCETTFYINNGKPLGYNGTYTPAFQVDAASGDFAATGSVPSSIGQAFTYESGNDYISWTWTTLGVFRTDLGQSFTVFPNGVMTASELDPGTRYFFYPFGDDNPLSSSDFYHHVVFVNDILGSPGGVGNFNNAYLNIDYGCIQAARRMDRIPLTIGALQAVTTTTSGDIGGGSYGGSGTCLHEETLVNCKEFGLIPLHFVEVGDLVDTPTGWSAVEHISFQENEQWVGITFAGHEDEGEYLCTLNHKWVLLEGYSKEAAKLSVGDLIPTKRGITHPTNIRLVRQLGQKARITVGTSDHVYYVGKVGIQTHNIDEIPC